VLCEANLAVLEDFYLDIVQVISDPYREDADTDLDRVEHINNQCAWVDRSMSKMQ
jgi:hypothetical protein